MKHNSMIDNTVEKYYFYSITSVLESAKSRVWRAYVLGVLACPHTSTLHAHVIDVLACLHAGMFGVLTWCAYLFVCLAYLLFLCP